MSLVPLAAQTLNLPPRSANALTGREFAGITTSMSLTQRENWIYAQIASGNVPNFLRSLTSVTTNSVINGTSHTITYFVTPDYLAIGSDTDYFLQPMTPLLGQRLADLLNCSMPTRKMVNDIWTKAPVKLTPATIPPSPEMTTVPIFVQHNNTVRGQRNAQTNLFPLGALVGGDKKDVVVSVRIYTNFATPSITKPVVIYGWHKPSDSLPIQPLYNGHEETYADYSHGIRLVQMNVTLDGISKMLTNVLTDANLAALVSDETTNPGNTISVPRYTISAGAPVITTQPFSQTVNAGAGASFSVLAAGTPPLNYQWKFNGTNISGATTTSFSLGTVQFTNDGIYAVTVGNGSGSVTSIPALLRVNTTNFPVLFRDNFETNSSTNWNLFSGSGNGVPDYTADWSFAYGTNIYTFNGQPYLIPPAPNSTNGTTRGIKFTVNDNDTNGWISGVNIYPKNQTFSGNFVLKCDLWINYPGGAGGTGASVTGSTEHALFGINHFGIQANWAATNTTSTDGIWFAVDGEGGTARDYRAYLGNNSGSPELIGAADSGLASADNASGIYPMLFPMTRFETNGALGKNWVEVEVIQTNNTVIWKLDRTVVAQRTNSSSFTNGNIMIGLMDAFSSVANPAKDSFALFDNVRVESLSEVSFGPVSRRPDGKFQVSLLGVAGENYQIEVSSNLWNWDPITILPGSNGPSVFVDDTAANLLIRFYRARRNPIP